MWLESVIPHPHIPHRTNPADHKPKRALWVSAAYLCFPLSTSQSISAGILDGFAIAGIDNSPIISPDRASLR
jgi:hypothetical protein